MITLVLIHASLSFAIGALKNQQTIYHQLLNAEVDYDCKHVYRQS